MRKHSEIWLPSLQRLTITVRCQYILDDLMRLLCGYAIIPLGFALLLISSLHRQDRLGTHSSVY